MTDHGTFDGLMPATAETITVTPTPDVIRIPVPPINPECAVGKHANCWGDAWDNTNDRSVACSCTCHEVAA